MIKQLLYFILFLLSPLVLLASHNRGGEITYENIGGYTYRITITTCTDVGSQAQADRNELTIDYGDGTFDTLIRSQETPQPFDHQKNKYIGIHTFPSAGTYILCMEDPNRNAGILNMANSDQQSFAIQSQLIISPFLGNGNNSVQFDQCPCPAIACVGNTYCYNPQAVDPDGDSLSYELVTPLGNCSGLGVGSYVLPHNHSGGSGFIDPISGTYCWDAPAMVGEFNFTIKITEWRNGFPVGFVMRDIQLTVDGACNNEPPVLNAPDEICVTAGENINFDITATDADGDNITLSATGSPFIEAISPSTFSSSLPSPNMFGTFNWNTNCSHIKPGVYSVLFAAEDNGDPSLAAYKTTIIKILPPVVTGVIATPFGNGINVNWSPSSCAQAEGYHIYRTTLPSFSFGDCCNNPSPLDVGFDLAGTVIGINNLSFTDNISLTLGINYCYVVTAFYNVNQVESCPSDTSCASLKKEVPILTHVSVIQTDASLGEDSVMWSKPTELDTNQFPGPYLYKVYSGSNISNINSFIGQTTSNNFLALADTAIVINNLNTSGNANYFRVELFYNHLGTDSLVGTSNSGGSIFLTTTPNDNQIGLNWSEDVPWINDSYNIYRSSNSSGPFSLIGSTSAQSYLDSGLVNGIEYCYYVESSGFYSNPTIINPILNKSQIVCESPVDLTPPCAPILSIAGDCELGENVLTWNNPNNSCADDVMSYNLYFTPVQGNTMTLIASFDDPNDTTFTHNYDGSIAGCYAIASIDSVQYSNESDTSNIVCFDNCPEYELPNVFTPNGDGMNDLYKSIVPYKYVESINIEIYNRWGQVIFQTSDPDVNWDGRHKDSGMPVPDGVYYYLCTVNTIRLTGIEPIQLNGFIHVFNNTGSAGQ